VTTPNIGNKVYLGSVLGVNIHAFGTISDLDTPDQCAFTIEGYGNTATLDTNAIVGPPGPAGSSAPLGKRMFPIYDSVDDLPTNLTDDDVDIGKYWIVRQWDENDPPNQIGSWWYMWNGSQYEQFKMGEPGQAGPVPNITWNFQVVDSDDPALDGGDVKTQETGSDYTPSVTVWVNKELIRGPEGPASAWDLYNEPTAPEVGDTLIWSGTKWEPSATGLVVPKFYTFPEASFVSTGLEIGTRVPIGNALIPPLEWDAVPYVQGHFHVTGIEFDTTPLIIGVEVRLGNATSGTVVARGFGNISGYAFLTPHASTATSANDAITPDNGRAVIPSGATGAAATLYVNAYNDGATGLYQFDATGAQLSVMMIPV
jgi:hypothetical protein